MLLLAPDRLGFLHTTAPDPDGAPGPVSHEFSHIQFRNGAYKAPPGFERAKAPSPIHVRVEADGAAVEWSCGRVTWLPAGWFQLTLKP